MCFKKTGTCNLRHYGFITLILHKLSKLSLMISKTMNTAIRTDSWFASSGSLNNELLHYRKAGDAGFSDHWFITQSQLDWYIWGSSVSFLYIPSFSLRALHSYSLFFLYSLYILSYFYPIISLYLHHSSSYHLSSSSYFFYSSSAHSMLHFFLFFC